eukprot:TRINITY_DN17417_c0_g2_i1.p1 TRINITY_DN17417_c0_g2~~TRINITY_DN17417_c0_g2_i1.p1  ORF type:complete len:716 (-),score=161.39 TRINITY_DN17417_c0_g2_i1:89-2236(-)
MTEASGPASESAGDTLGSSFQASSITSPTRGDETAVSPVVSVADNPSPVSPRIREELATLAPLVGDIDLAAIGGPEKLLAAAVSVLSDVTPSNGDPKNPESLPLLKQKLSMLTTGIQVLHAQIEQKTLELHRKTVLSNGELPERSSPASPASGQAVGSPRGRGPVLCCNMAAGDSPAPSAVAAGGGGRGEAAIDLDVSLESPKEVRKQGLEQRGRQSPPRPERGREPPRVTFPARSPARRTETPTRSSLEKGLAAGKRSRQGSPQGRSIAAPTAPGTAAGPPPLLPLPAPQQPGRRRPSPEGRARFPSESVASGSLRAAAAAAASSQEAMSAQQQQQQQSGRSSPSRGAKPGPKASGGGSGRLPILRDPSPKASSSKPGSVRRSPSLQQDEGCTAAAQQQTSPSEAAGSALLASANRRSRSLTPDLLQPLCKSQSSGSGIGSEKLLPPDWRAMVAAAYCLTTGHLLNDRISLQECSSVCGRRGDSHVFWLHCVMRWADFRIEDDDGELGGTRRVPERGEDLTLFKLHLRKGEFCTTQPPSSMSGKRGSAVNKRDVLQAIWEVVSVQVLKTTLGPETPAQLMKAGQLGASLFFDAMNSSTGSRAPSPRQAATHREVEDGSTNEPREAVEPRPPSPPRLSSKAFVPSVPPVSAGLSSPRSAPSMAPAVGSPRATPGVPAVFVSPRGTPAVPPALVSPRGAPGVAMVSPTVYRQLSLR